MAKIVEERITIVLSRLIKKGDPEDELDRVLTNEQIETLQEAVEGLVENNSVVVEIENE